jgi:hypothetical protein
MAAVTGAIIAGASAVGSLVGSIDAKDKASRAERSAQARLDKALADRKPVINPYGNLSVDTKAAEFEAEQTDKALANSLDAMTQAGVGAGSATAVAQAAIASKQNISKTISEQEQQNKLLEAKGRQMQWEGEEARSNMDINRYASLQQQYAQQKQDANAAMWSSIGGMASSIGEGISSAYGSKSKKEKGD